MGDADRWRAAAGAARRAGPGVRRRRGWWTDASLGSMVAEGLAGLGPTQFHVWSKVHPWDGTFADVDAVARSLATSLAAQGVGPGSVVVLQLPNWMEAGVAFFAATYLGAVVVPVVHFYGPKEVGYILTCHRAGGRGHPRPLWHTDHLAMYDELLAAHPGHALAGGRRCIHRAPASGGRTRHDLRPRTGHARRRTVDPDSPALIAFTSGTTRDPKGVVHSHHTIAVETRQLADMFARWWATPAHRGARRHFIGMVGAFLVPLLRRERRSTRRRVERRRGAAASCTRRASGSSAAPPSSSPACSTTPTSPTSTWRSCPTQGSAGPPSRRRWPSGSTRSASPFRSYGSTEHPSITGSPPTAPREKRLYHRRLCECRAWSCASTTTGRS